MSQSVFSGEAIDPVLAELIEEITDKLQKGEPVDLEAYIQQHPERAEELGKLLPALHMLAVAGSADGPPAAVETPLPGVLGDFRIVGEIGRGGMGVVYEAEQISLRRRVALKVLPFAAMMDPRHLQRFKNEAQAAACLHQNHIVPVYFVGCERGVHFYAMQLIEGQTLAALVGALRARGQAGDQLSLTHTENGAARVEKTTANTPPAALVSPSATTLPRAMLSTDTPQERAAYYRQVAQWGVQAAEALDYAHQMGVVHRDVKPGNLMVDGRGEVWITDFGLAQIQQGEASLTMTGDLVGTLRYMSPEQALAKRVVIDHRTDVYSLGATLYELLTLRPAFPGRDRQEVLRQIAFEEPSPPRRLNRAVPAELEVVVLKALEKSPADRYATAQELADDLRRWLDDRPIQARRPSWRQVALKWARRHKPVVWAAAVVVLLAVVLGGAAGLWRFQQRVVAETEANVALEDAARLQEHGKLPEALWAIRRAEPLWKAGLLGAGLVRRVRERQTDLKMLDTLDDIRLQQAAVKENHLDTAVGDPTYELAFQDYGIDVLKLGPAEAAEGIKASGIRVELAAALDDWASVRRKTRPKEDTTWKELLAIARAADPDDWRNRLRDAMGREDMKAVKELAASDDAAALSAVTALLLGNILSRNNLKEEAVALLRRAQQQHPGDFWINFELAYLLYTGPPQLEESIRFYTAALALRPLSAAVHNNLGNVRHDQGRLAEAEAEYRKAIDLDPKYAFPHNGLGNVRNDQGRLAEAEAEYHKAIDLGPKYAVVHYNLGRVLLHQGRLAEAEAEYRKAIDLDSKDARPHHDLGNVRCHQGRLAEAEAEFRKAIDLNPKYALPHNNLGIVLKDQGRLAEAEAEYRKAMELAPELAHPHNGLGNMRHDQGRLEGAEAEFRKAIDLDPKCAATHNSLGNMRQDQGRLEEAEAEYRKAIDLDPKYAQPHNGLGNVRHRQGRLEEAEAEYRKAIDLDSKYALPHNGLGNMRGKEGRMAEAEAEFRKAIELDPKFAAPHNGLGDVRSNQGRLEEAEAEFRKAIELDPKDAAPHNSLGVILCEHKGDYVQGEAEFKAALHLKPDHPEFHRNLGNALASQGRLKEASAEYRKAVELGSKQAAPMLRACERQLALRQRLSGLVTGQDRPANQAERLAFAELCQQPFERRNALATRLYAEAFAADPKLADDLGPQHRYDAACVAALAGCGQGRDADKVDTKERARLRKQALDWLRADLKAYRQVMDKSGIKAGPEIVQKMQHWLQDTDFTGVRGPEALGRLPEAERGDWQKLWEEVKALRQRALKPAQPASRARP